MTELEKQIHNAFREFMVSRFRIPKAAIPAYWDIFYKSLEWRLKRVKIGNESKSRPR